MQAKENFERFKREYQTEYPQVVKDWERDLEEILTLLKVRFLSFSLDFIFSFLFPT